MRKPLVLALLLAILFTSCTDNHFISDRTYRKKVEAQFEKQKELAKNRSQQLFSVFRQDISTPEKEALQFIYAYSSLSDLADYNGDFFLKNIRASFAARDTFSWGKKVPENLFRHFVLPVRVNNENLDSSRWVFFEELKDRIRNKPMKEAVLEVNHWCHEKVMYRGTDGRTSSPLATVKTAYGRCGEESTFTVAALRSVGIPARQCYTPRWAHCDDNHAWVEVWVDGKWHFIGACEPGAGLDLAWFTKPAKRAMLVNTTVFGDYEGPEDVLLQDPLFTRINVLENYAPVKRVYAKVTDAGNSPVDSAAVEFQLYNYAEFYPLFTTLSDKNGLCTFKTGFGDLLVWAAKNGKYGFAKLDVRVTDTITIQLLHNSERSLNVEFDFVPPAEKEIDEIVSDSANKINGQRLVFEDKMRTAYEETFIDSSKSFRFAELVKLNPDTLWQFLHKSCGNWREIMDFITGTDVKDRRLVFPLLANISEKDLRDANPETLRDVVVTAEKYPSMAPGQADFAKYILSPRADNEWLRPHRVLFQKVFDAVFIEKSRNNPETVAGWIRDSITLSKSANYSRAPITPAGVYELRVADKHSIDIFFVAVCRSFGIPSRLDPATRVPQFYSGNTWIEVNLFNETEQPGNKGTLTLNNHPDNEKKPEYTIHYTVETLKDGFFKTLDYEESELVKDYPCTIEVPAGPALLVTGNRLTDGTVLAGLSFFIVNPDGTDVQTILLRKAALPGKIYGTIDPSMLPEPGITGTVIAWIDPGQEPTRHLLADLRAKKAEFCNTQAKFIMVLPSEQDLKTFSVKETATLPACINFVFPSIFPMRPENLKLLGGIPKQFPVVIFVSNKGEISFLSEGYRIGTGDELLGLMK